MLHTSLSAKENHPLSLSPALSCPVLSITNVQRRKSPLKALSVFLNCLDRACRGEKNSYEKELGTARSLDIDNTIREEYPSSPGKCSQGIQQTLMDVCAWQCSRGKRNWHCYFTRIFSYMYELVMHVVIFLMCVTVSVICGEGVLGHTRLSIE